MKFDIGCQQASRLFSEGMDGELPTVERTRLRLHLVLCHTCRGVSEQMQFLRRAMQALDRHPPDDDPPAPPP